MSEDKTRWCDCHHALDEHLITGDRPCTECRCPNFAEIWACGACGAEYDQPGPAQTCYHSCVGVL